MDKTSFLIGKKISLRPLEKSDLNQTYAGWLNDPQVSAFLVSTVFPTSMVGLETFYENLSASRNDVMLAIIRRDTGKHIGNIKLGNINWVHRFADLGILIGDKKSWGKGLGQEACRLLLAYAFQRLNLNKVTLSVHANHMAAIKAYENAGFVVEGKLTGMLYHNGKYDDQLIMAISRERFIK